ncbi:hypothetical protein [Psychrobacillus sp. L3]|uniref:hypothetical protein n=1 Tax=Psychrobacillus sp. L3 TaxID=3236891 RepID=UPI0036F2419B
MKDSPIKKGLDAAIGKEQWMDDELIRRMVKQRNNNHSKKKSKVSWFFLPLFVLVFLCFGVLTFSQIFDKQETIESLPADLSDNYGNLYKTIVVTTNLEEVADAFINYLTCIEQGDINQLKAYSFYENEEDLKQIVNMYKGVDFSSIKIESIIPSRAEPSYEVKIVTHNLAKPEMKFIHSIHINFYDESSVDTYEQVLEKWSTFEPFIAQKEVFLRYSDLLLGSFNEVEKQETDISKIVATQNLRDDIELQLLKKEDTVVAQLVKGEMIVDLGRVSFFHLVDDVLQDVQIQIQDQQIGPLTLLGLVGTIQEGFTYIFYDEKHMEFKGFHLVGIPTFIDINQDGINEILLETEEKGETSIMVLSYEEPNFKVTNINNAFKQNDYVNEEINTTLKSRNIHMFYKNTKGTQEFIYQLKGLESLQLVE